SAGADQERVDRRIVIDDGTVDVEDDELIDELVQLAGPLRPPASASGESEQLPHGHDGDHRTEGTGLEPIHRVETAAELVPARKMQHTRWCRGRTAPPALS